MTNIFTQKTMLIARTGEEYDNMLKLIREQRPNLYEYIPETYAMFSNHDGREYAEDETLPVCILIEADPNKYGTWQPTDSSSVLAPYNNAVDWLMNNGYSDYTPTEMSSFQLSKTGEISINL